MTYTSEIESRVTQKTQLKTAALGSAELEITRVGLGAWAIGGGGWEFGWGPQEGEDSIAAIHRALELGVNWIDTAAAYGFGRSHRDQLEALADALMEHETLDEAEAYAAAGIAHETDTLILERS